MVRQWCYSDLVAQQCRKVTRGGCWAVPGGHQGGGEAVSQVQQGAGEARLLPRMAALPRWSRMPILLQRWEMASPSSCPMCLARAAPSFFTSLPAPTCQSPNDALSPTLLFCPVHFSVKGMVLSVIGCVGRYWHGGSLEGRYYGSVVISPRLQRHICH